MIGTLFASPFRNPQMLWITIPVYLNWLFTEFYQEKKGTSMGNAITNGFVALWVGIDWMRTTIDLLEEKLLKSASALPKFGVAILMGLYGLTIIVLGIRGNKSITYLGRIREVTYLTVMLTPIFYGAVTPTFEVILSIVIFFPIFYGIVSIIDYYAPTPEIYNKAVIENPVNSFPQPSRLPSPNLSSTRKGSSFSHEFQEWKR